MLQGAAVGMEAHEVGPYITFGLLWASMGKKGLQHWDKWENAGGRGAAKARAEKLCKQVRKAEGVHEQARLGPLCT